MRVTPSKRHRARTRGLTLLELMVVIGVVVMLSGLGITGLSRLSSVQLRTQTNRIAAAVRHAYNRSVAEGLYMRMVFDMEADRYWVEASSTAAFIPVEPREEDSTDDSAKDGEDTDGEPKSKAQFRKVIKEVTMQRGIQIEGVLTSGQDDVFESGRAMIYFFPNGFVEPSMIYTSDGEETFFTLVVNPMTGHVKRHAGKVDPDSRFGEPDRVEEEGR